VVIDELSVDVAVLVDGVVVVAGLVVEVELVVVELLSVDVRLLLVVLFVALLVLSSYPLVSAFGCGSFHNNSSSCSRPELTSQPVPPFLHHNKIPRENLALALEMTR
jgi:hypothetical protein